MRNNKKNIRFFIKKNKANPINITTIARKASQFAVKESLEAGLEVSFIQNNTLVRRRSDGTIQRVKTIEKATAQRTDIKKGTILCLK